MATVITEQSVDYSFDMNGNSGTLTVPATAGFMYVQLPDPFAGQKVLDEVIRSDGKILKPDNAWLSRVKDEDLNLLKGDNYHEH